MNIVKKKKKRKQCVYTYINCPVLTTTPSKDTFRHARAHTHTHTHTHTSLNLFGVWITQIIIFQGYIVLHHVNTQ